MFTLLLVDDEPDSRLLVAHALKDSNTFRVIGEAVGVEDAVSLASSSHPDIVMLDPVIRGEDGLWALPLVREATPEAKVVLHAAFPPSELRFAALSGGAVGYLEKGRSPLTLADDLLAVCGLLDVIESGIDESKARLGANPHTPRLARRFVKSALDRWAAKGEIELVELLVSELVTNSIIHARSDVEVSVTVASDVARVSVFDSSFDPPVRKTVRPDGASGRGLVMLDALASAWGISYVPGGKSVWFEIKNELR
jgi:DNA-binding NarL/FixJ family response regulator